ncbi:hypothetical protein [Campylobacter estrildidarum]|uniref:hypothetical protein n=1 Tax=Campylobacter estrildidarum TaxID=2510189 RepID=UPI001485060F|nr:hypothetical protein [Campylobacter estrildidarum]
MAFYNPQRVVFNPNTGVIQNAGKVGGVLYDIMSKNYDDKVKANQFQQEQELRQQQIDYRAKQDEFNNALALQRFDFEKQKQAQDNALNWARYKENKDYNEKYLEYLNNKDKGGKINNFGFGGFDIDGFLNGDDTTKNKDEFLGILSDSEIKLMKDAPKIKKEIGVVDNLVDYIATLGQNRETYNEQFYNEANKNKDILARLKYGSQVTNKQMEDIDKRYGLPKNQIIRDQIPLDRALKLKQEQKNAFLKEIYEKAQKKLSDPRIFNNPELREMVKQEYQKTKNLVNNQYNEYEKWIKGQPNYYNSKPRNVVYIDDDNGTLGTKKIDTKELVEKNMQKYKNHLMPGTPAGFIPFVDDSENVVLTPKDKKINIDGKNAYITKPDNTGNIAIELEDGTVIQSTLLELQKSGVKL